MLPIEYKRFLYILQHLDKLHKEMYNAIANFQYELDQYKKIPGVSTLQVNKRQAIIIQAFETWTNQDKIFQVLPKEAGKAFDAVYAERTRIIKQLLESINKSAESELVVLNYLKEKIHAKQ